MDWYCLCSVVCGGSFFGERSVILDELQAETGEEIGRGLLVLFFIFAEYMLATPISLVDLNRLQR